MLQKGNLKPIAIFLSFGLLRYLAYRYQTSGTPYHALYLSFQRKDFKFSVKVVTNKLLTVSLNKYGILNDTVLKSFRIYNQIGYCQLIETDSTRCRQTT
jgi:hypothetical protein